VELWQPKVTIFVPPGDDVKCVILQLRLTRVIKGRQDLVD